MRHSLLFFAFCLSACDCGGEVATCITESDCEDSFACIDGVCVASSDSGVSDAELADEGVDARVLDGASGDMATDAGDDAGVLPPGACVVEPSISPFDNPEVELHWDATGLPFPGYSHSVMSPIVIDFLDDPGDEQVPEIIFNSYSGTFSRPGVIRIISGRAPYATRMTLAGDGTGPVLDDMAATPSILKDAHLAAGDLDGDGRPELVAVLQGGGLIALRNDGTELWRISAADIPNAEVNPNASVAIADLEGDGVPEVIVGRVVVEGREGTVRFIGTGTRGRNGQGPLSCVADVVSSSPGQEVIAGRSVYATDGTLLYEMPGRDGFCAVADIFDADGEMGTDGVPEIIRVDRGTLRISAGETGEQLWSRAIPGCSGCSGGAPTVADFDADGLIEIGVAGATRYAVIDPGCAGDPLPDGCASAGVLWSVSTNDASSHVTSSTVFDFNGDGAAEVVYNDERHFFVFEGRTGAELFREPNPSRTRTEQPIVADVDNDGNAEIVFSANAEHAIAGSGIPPEERIPGVEIWSSADDSWVGARPIWNQHTYHITNVEPGGIIPSPEPASWLTHNSYRLNRPVEDVLAAPDLTANLDSLDLSRCGEGILLVCANVQNRGDVRVGPGLEVIFYDGDPDAGGTALGTVLTETTIDRGGVERVCYEWNPAPTEAHQVFVRVDGADSARECVEDNNLVDLGPARCRSIM